MISGIRLFSQVAALNSDPITEKGSPSAVVDSVTRVAGGSRRWSPIARTAVVLLMAGALAACESKVAPAPAVQGAQVSCTAEVDAAKQAAATEREAAIKAAVEPLNTELETLRGEKATLDEQRASVAAQQVLIDQAVEKALGTTPVDSRARLKALQAEVAKLTQDQRNELEVRIENITGRGFGFTRAAFDVPSAKEDTVIPALATTLHPTDVLGELATRGQLFVGDVVKVNETQVVDKGTALPITSLGDLKAWLDAHGARATS